METYVVGWSNSNSAALQRPTKRNHMSDFLKVLNDRASAEHFFKELIFEACQAPSSFDIQRWRFIAVTDE
jgi:hypothetical protein